jgi:hypothetical protein
LQFSRAREVKLEMEMEDYGYKFGLTGSGVHSKINFNA